MNQRERMLGGVFYDGSINFTLRILAYRELTPREIESCYRAYLDQLGKRQGTPNQEAVFRTNYGLEPGL